MSKDDVPEEPTEENQDAGQPENPEGAETAWKMKLIQFDEILCCNIMYFHYKF